MGREAKCGAKLQKIGLGAHNSIDSGLTLQACKHRNNDNKLMMGFDSRQEKTSKLHHGKPGTLITEKAIQDTDCTVGDSVARTARCGRGAQV